MLTVLIKSTSLLADWNSGSVKSRASSCLPLGGRCRPRLTPGAVLLEEGAGTFAPVLGKEGDSQACDQSRGRARRDPCAHSRHPSYDAGSLRAFSRSPRICSGCQSLP